MDCPKKAVHNLLTITANIQGGVPWKISSETLSKPLKKYLRKSSFFSEVADSKNKFIHTYFSKILLKV